MTRARDRLSALATAAPVALPGLAPATAATAAAPPRQPSPGP